MRPNKSDETISQCDPISTAAAFRPLFKREQEQYEKAAIDPTDQEYGTGDMASAVPRTQRSDMVNPSDQDERSYKSPPLAKYDSKPKRPPSSKEFAPARSKELLFGYLAPEKQNATFGPRIIKQPYGRGEGVGPFLELKQEQYQQAATNIVGLEKDRGEGLLDY